jgi:hypothetical protein
MTHTHTSPRCLRYFCLFSGLALAPFSRSSAVTSSCYLRYFCSLSGVCLCDSIRARQSHPLTIYGIPFPSMWRACVILLELPGHTLSLFTVLLLLQWLALFYWSSPVTASRHLRNFWSLSGVCLRDSTRSPWSHLLAIHGTFAPSVGCACAIPPQLPSHTFSLFTIF